MKYIYLHGFASGPSSKKAQFFRKRLEDLGVQLEVPDLTEGDFEGLTLTRQLRVVERTAAGEPAVLIGSSLGGYTAALYAARHPETQRLLLLAPAFQFARRWAESLGDQQMEAWRQTGKLTVYHYSAGAGREIGFGLMEDARQYEAYPDLPQPALIFHGGRDSVVPAGYSLEFAAQRPNVRLKIVDSDHELLDVLESIWTESVDFLTGGGLTGAL